MNAIAEKIIDQALAMPVQDRAFLAHKLLASLDEAVDANAQSEWDEVIDRRSADMEKGRIDSRSEEEVMKAIQAKLDVARRPSS